MTRPGTKDPFGGARAAAAIAALCAPLLLAFGAAELARAAEAPPPATDAADPEARWESLRAHYFGEREVGDGAELIALEAPGRAHDAAVVPVTVRALDPTADIRRVHLIVDQNPLPLAGVFHFEEGARGWEALETRIRINEYTNVRAVAELADGSLHQAVAFVKASGGCSAPAMADLDAALANAGRMKLLIDEITAAGLPASEGTSPVGGSEPAGDARALAAATIKISHPNNSGMQFDQLSRNYIPAFFVERIGASIGGTPLIEVDTNFSLSENPTVALTFPRAGDGGELAVEALDSKGNRYEGTLALPTGGGS